MGDLLREIRKILATDRVWTLCIVRVGHLGKAIVENENFGKRGYNFVAAFDKNPNKTGRTLSSGLIIEPLFRLKQRVRELQIQIGVMTTPPDNAQWVADQLMDAGLKGILNFSPAQVKTPEGCIVENVDFAVRFENLAYHLSKVR